MTQLQLTIVFADNDEDQAKALAQQLQDRGYTFAPLRPEGVLVAVVSPAGLKSMELRQMISEAFKLNSPVVLVETESSTLPQMARDLEPVRLTGSPNDVDKVIAAIEQAANEPDTLESSTPKDAPQPAPENTRNPNLRFGLIVGGGILLLFGLYTIAIALFDIEAPQEEFQELYTRDAMTINAFAQEYMPRSTEQAENFEVTLESVGSDLATLVVQTATQAATEGGFTPQPTGLVIENELSEVRQTATGDALLRQRQTEQSDLSDENIAATATSAAATANAELDAQNLTVTAASE